jgi:agmatinase
MPSTGTPEPGGLTWNEIITLIKIVSEKKKIVGFDVVELMPITNLKAPDFMTAKLIYRILGYIFG